MCFDKVFMVVLVFLLKKGYHPFSCADVVELVDTPDLGSGASRCEGSSPFVRTILNPLNYDILSFFQFFSM